MDSSVEVGLSTCLSRQWEAVEGNHTETGSRYCSPIWDGFTCWGPTKAGMIATSRCPSFKGSDITKSAFRICSDKGEWLDRNGFPSSRGWTNYTPCLTPEILEVMRRLGSNDDAQLKINIAANTRTLEFVGLTLSLGALLVSLGIFYYFRTLRNTRTRLHRHLFIAMVIQVAIRLIVYTDQAITRTMESERNDATTRNPGESQKRWGIDNTPILCEASYISLEYARTAMFMWMFVEGLFLHNMITVTVFEEKLSPYVYPIIGWVIPIPLTLAWAVVTHLHYGTATYVTKVYVDSGSMWKYEPLCWWGYSFTLYFWILEGPRLAVLVINLAFLLNILRVLVLKLRQTNSSETHQALKAVKAALVLLPLLGLTNLLNMLNAPLEKSPFQFALWSYTTHTLTSTQGFILAFLYCFRNGEVQMAIRKFVRIRILGHGQVPTRVPSVSMSQILRKNKSIRKNNDIITQSKHPHSKQMKAVGTSSRPSLIVRSFSNAVLSQAAVRINPHHKIQPYHYENEGRNPLLHKHSDHFSVVTSPIIMAIASPSTEGSGSVKWDKRTDMSLSETQQHERDDDDLQVEEGYVVAKQMLIIPELILSMNRKQGQIDDIVVVPLPKQRDDNTGTEVVEENVKGYYFEDLDQEDVDYVCIEINQDSSSSENESRTCFVPINKGDTHVNKDGEVEVFSD